MSGSINDYAKKYSKEYPSITFQKFPQDGYRTYIEIILISHNNDTNFKVVEDIIRDTSLILDIYHFCEDSDRLFSAYNNFNSREKYALDCLRVICDVEITVVLGDDHEAFSETFKYLM